MLEILNDNGGEFSNIEFMCEAMNTYAKFTATNSPSSNVLVKRHNLIIADMLDKIKEESQLHDNLALAWCLNAKNSIANVDGFHPFSLINQ